jgi:hypothetical protein
MKPGATAFDGDPDRGELARPAAREADLRALGGHVGRPARWRTVDDFGVDLDDAAGSPRGHSRQHGAAEQHRALDEKLELGDVVLPRHLGERGLGLRPGGVEHQHVDGSEAARHRVHEIHGLPLVGDVGGEGVGNPIVVADRVDDLGRLRATVAVVDGHREPVAGEAQRDRAAQPAGAARHESDALRRHARDRTVAPSCPERNRAEDHERCSCACSTPR